MKKILGLVMIVSLAWGCKSAKPFFSPEAEALIGTHKKVAILPFSVRFSEDYKRLSGKGKLPWEEQERRAGIDLQRSSYEYLAKRVNKKGLDIIVQDFLTTNKALEQAGIGYSELMHIDKGRLAPLLGVDAVIFGNSSMEYNMRGGYMGNNGINSTLNLYDGTAGLKIWSMDDKEYIRGRFDSPQDLARRSVDELLSMLPYKTHGKKKNV